MASLEAFYRKVLGLRVINREANRIWLAIGESTRLGLWSPGEKEFGDQGGRHVHFAVSVTPDSLDELAQRLQEAGIPTEGPVEHDGGDRSLYFRDPAGNLVEAWDFFKRGPGARRGVDARSGRAGRQNLRPAHLGTPAVAAGLTQADRPCGSARRLRLQICARRFPLHRWGEICMLYMQIWTPSPRDRRWGTNCMLMSSRRAESAARGARRGSATSLVTALRSVRPLTGALMPVTRVPIHTTIRCETTVCHHCGACVRLRPPSRLRCCCCSTGLAARACCRRRRPPRHRRRH
jgi:extradiol dioxygenase family protein